MPNLMFHVFYDERFMDLSLYQYGYEKCSPLHSYGPSIRNHYLFHYIISGKGTLLTDNKHNQSKKYAIEAGMGFLIEPEYINTYTADQEDPWEYTWIEFGGLRAREIIESAGLSSSSPIYIPKKPEFGDNLKNEMLYLCEHSMDSSLKQLGHLYLIMDAILEGSTSKRQVQGGKLSQFYTHEAITFIEQHYMLPITVENMADHCNLDRSYFGKIFKETMGQSPQEFLINYRMTKASVLLKTTDLPIGNISLLVGYSNQLHFSRSFKKIYNLSPREYRQNNKLI